MVANKHWPSAIDKANYIMISTKTKQNLFHRNILFHVFVYLHLVASCRTWCKEQYKSSVTLLSWPIFLTQEFTLGKLLIHTSHEELRRVLRVGRISLSCKFFVTTYVGKGRMNSCQGIHVKLSGTTWLLLSNNCLHQQELHLPIIEGRWLWFGRKYQIIGSF